MPRTIPEGTNAALFHFESFVDAFIVPQKRERWKYLYRHKSANLFKDSSRFRTDLKKVLLTPFSPGSTASVISTAKAAEQGYYFDFRGEGVPVDLDEALRLGTGRDAVFSLLPGKLGIFFFHEDEIWLCSKEST